MKVGFLSLGCKANSYDTEAVLSLFKNKGYDIVREHEFADIFVINTCSVTNVAERKSRQAIERVLKLNPNAIIVMTGCYAQIKPDEVKALRNVAVVVGTRDRKNIVELTEKYITSGENQSRISNLTNHTMYEDIDISDCTGHTRVQIKIQDGCNNFCTYCIIPYARGRICSKPLDKVIEQVQRIHDQGCNEIVLTGIHIASYGKDLGDITLTDLIENIHEATNGSDMRIRLGSLDPCIVTEDFAKRISVLERFCPQFHLSLQSGSDTVLKRMNRHYTASEYFNGVSLLRKYFDDPAFTTDIIVGFPGETEKEFEETLNFAKKVDFAKIHIFPYSRREGTVAAKMPDQIPHNIAIEREKRLSQIEADSRKKYISKWINKNINVLFEEEKIICGQKFICGYSPEYVYVKIPYKESLLNTIHTVHITSFDSESAYGNIIE